METGRRSQQDRREQTISKLLAATSETILEVGYAHTTVQGICHRAGLSQGALFRHFPNRQALVIATAEHVAQEITDSFADRVGESQLGQDGLLEVLYLLRDFVRGPECRVWFELLLAARTDRELKDHLVPALRDFQRRTLMVAMHVSGPEFPADARLIAGLRIVMSYLDGEAMVSSVSPDPDSENAALELLAELLELQIALFRERTPQEDR